VTRLSHPDSNGMDAPTLYGIASDDSKPAGASKRVPGHHSDAPNRAWTRPTQSVWSRGLGNDRGASSALLKRARRRAPTIGDSVAHRTDRWRASIQDADSAAHNGATRAGAPPFRGRPRGFPHGHSAGGHIQQWWRLRIFNDDAEGMRITVRTIVLIDIVLMLIGVISTWPHSRSRGDLPSGGVGLALIVVVALLVMGRL
jgi:hypothetical protein